MKMKFFILLAMASLAAFSSVPTIADDTNGNGQNMQSQADNQGDNNSASTPNDDASNDSSDGSTSSDDAGASPDTATGDDDY